jgi:type IV pilus assembly protein PilY1
VKYSIPSNPKVIDIDNDGYIDHVYIGDIGGQLWKFDFTTPARLTGGASGTVNDADWKGKRFFRAGNDANPSGNGAEYYPSQAIYYAPGVAFDDDRKLWLYFGTGDRNHPLNATTTANRFYGVKDDPVSNMTNGSVITEATTGMVNSTSVTTVPTVGWYHILSSSDKEKVLAASDVFNKVVWWTTFLPSGSAACGAGGYSKLYAVQMQSAFAAINWDANVPYAFSGTGASDVTKARGENLGAGIASPPVIAINRQGDVLVSIVYVGLSGAGASTGGGGGGGGGAACAGTLCQENGGPLGGLRSILYWKENF